MHTNSGIYQKNINVLGHASDDFEDMYHKLILVCRVEASLITTGKELLHADIQDKHDGCVHGSCFWFFAYSGVTCYWDGVQVH